MNEAGIVGAAIALNWVQESKWLTSKQKTALARLIKQGGIPTAHAIFELMMIADYRLLEESNIERQKSGWGIKQLGNRNLHPNRSRAVRKFLRAIAAGNLEAILAVAALFLVSDEPEHFVRAERQKLSSAPKRKGEIIREELNRHACRTDRPAQIIAAIRPEIVKRFKAHGITLPETNSFLYPHISRWRKGD